MLDFLLSWEPAEELGQGKATRLAQFVTIGLDISTSVTRLDKERIMADIPIFYFSQIKGLLPKCLFCSFT